MTPYDGQVTDRNLALELVRVSEAAALAAITVAAIFVLMIGASLGRLFEWRVGWVNDVVSWLCAAAAFMGMAHAFKNGDFVRVTLLLERLSPALKRGFEIASLLLATLALAVTISPPALTGGWPWDRFLGALGRPADAGPSSPLVPLLAALLPVPLLLIFAMARRAFSSPPPP